MGGARGRLRGRLRAGGGCGSGRVCAPRAPLDYAGDGLCISKTGDGLACPAGWSVPVVGYTGGTDARGCSACKCTSNASCSGGSYDTWDSPVCNTGPTNIAEGQCKLIDYFACDGTWSVRRKTSPVASGSCTATGGQPTGQIDTAGAVTFCCQ